MINYDRGDVLVAPFRFTDVNDYKTRPVLVVSRADIYAETGNVVAAMITSARRSDWPLDVAIDQWREVGLTKPCLVRMKIVTLAVETVEASLGQMDKHMMSKVQSQLEKLFGTA